MSGVYVEVQDYGNGKILKTPTGEYRYMDADRNVSKKSYDNVTELLDGEKLRDGAEAKQVQERTRRSKGTTEGADGSSDVVEGQQEQQAVVEDTEGETKPAKKTSRKRSTKKA